MALGCTLCGARIQKRAHNKGNIHPIKIVKQYRLF